MRSFILLSIFVFLAAVSIEARVFRDTNEEFRQEYCDESWFPKGKHCSGIKCNKENTKTVDIGCAVIFLGEDSDCKIVEDLDKPYPQCCPDFVCENN